MRQRKKPTNTKFTVSDVCNQYLNENKYKIFLALTGSIVPSFDTMTIYFNLIFYSKITSSFTFIEALISMGVLNLNYKLHARNKLFFHGDIAIRVNSNASVIYSCLITYYKGLMQYL